MRLLSDYEVRRVEYKGIPFWVRNGTVDENVLEEVIAGDTYRLEQINLREQPNIVDVGGHIGGFTKYAAWRWPHGRFFTYEANPRNWEIITKNLEDISDKITLFKGALVGREPANKRLVINPAEAATVTGGWGIIYADEVYETGDESAVEEIERFYYLNNLFPILDKIDILKLDCEGSEFSIIDAMTEEQLGRVDYIVAEVHCGALGHAPMTYQQFRKKILNQFICPQLEARPECGPHDLFSIVACNRKLLG